MSDNASPVSFEAALFSALIAARAEMRELQRTREADIPTKTGSFSYSYAPLDEVIKVAGEVLFKHGLTVLQAPRRDHDGRMILETRLLHESGSEYRCGEYLLPENLASQQMGAAITYARRYVLSAVLFISAADDIDARGEESQEPAPRKRAKREPTAQATANSPRQASEGQIIYLRRLADQKLGCGHETVDIIQAFAQNLEGVKLPTEHLHELTAADANAIIDVLLKRADQPRPK
jgi:hypothetical protein